MPDLGVKTTRQAVYQTAYHAVWIPKYRKCVLIDAVADHRRGLISEVAHLRTRR
jgi:REP element-mobilizing transposase RayT